MPLPIQYDGQHLDLSPRVFKSTVVAASPGAATETTICTVTCTGDIAVVAGVILVAFFSITIGTSGALLTYKLRRTDTSGTTLASSGTETVTACQLYGRSIVAFDTGPTMPGQVYVLTATVGSGAATSTVTTPALVAVVV